MATIGGPIIPGNTKGLIFYVDPSNPDSYLGNGNTWKDISNETGDATLINGVQFSGFSKGSSFILDGVNDYINLPSSLNQIHGSSEASLSIWSKLQRGQNSSGRAGILQLSGYDNNNGCLYFYTDSARNGGIWLDVFLTTRYFTGDYFPTFDPRNWHNLSITSQPGTNGWKMYLNGELQYQNSGPSTISVNNSRGFNLGRNSLFRELWGNIGPFYLYNRALTPQEILQNYNATKSRFNL